jgi:hypothetical protein
VHARHVWHTVFQSLGLSAAVPGIDSTLEKSRINFDTLVILVDWSLWKNMNAWVFGHRMSQFPADQLAARILEELNQWILARSGVDGVFIDTIVSR